MTSPLMVLIVSIAFLGAYASFDSAADNNNKPTSKAKTFGHNPLSSNGLQGWHNWGNNKRGGLDATLASWNIGDTPVKSLQSWNDWVNKRGAFPTAFENGRIGSSDKAKMQAWRDWVYKRGLFSAEPKDFTYLGSLGFDKGQLQQWNNFVSKRGLFRNDFRGVMFPTVLGTDKGQLQQWNNWAKRNFNAQPATFGMYPDNGESFQTWSDFMKRQGIFPSNPLNEKGQFQTWQDWSKRMDSDDITGKLYLGNRDRFMNWRAMFKRSANKKRRLSNDQQNKFMSSHNMFNNGLQSWGSSFNDRKRSLNAGKTKEAAQ